MSEIKEILWWIPGVSSKVGHKTMMLNQKPETFIKRNFHLEVQNISFGGPVAILTSGLACSDFSVTLRDISVTQIIEKYQEKLWQAELIFQKGRN